MNQEKSTQTPHISVAPMMDWTDRHCRFFLRLIAPNVRLYTEMVTVGALLHGDAERFLRFDESEHPVALQLGGSDADDLARCAEMGQKAGYDEINLNCGCPSDRVQSGRFGACLMREPDHVADCIEAMIKAVDIPVTVKCRIGVDDQDDQQALDEFVGRIADKGCKTFIIHARKAWLKGLSPKENRDIPPLNYERVTAVKKTFPDLEIITNGGIKTVEDIYSLLSPCKRGTLTGNKTDSRFRGKSDKAVDGVMIGREAYSNPYILAEIERKIFGNHDILGREKIAKAMIEYAKNQAARYDTPIKSITRHIIGLYHHQPGAKAWRQALSTLPHKDGAGPEVIEEALSAMKNHRKIAA
ncbi:MAG: tRNA dihydrouridine(20/20a) synthase DusA [Alphaproteobacteria bacterium]|nr:tRNA dihydrouridine(20/20a) synthase DusA [Alphaproteobacteria bacterium]